MTKTSSKQLKRYALITQIINYAKRNNVIDDETERSITANYFKNKTLKEIKEIRKEIIKTVIDNKQPIVSISLERRISNILLRFKNKPKTKETIEKKNKRIVIITTIITLSLIAILWLILSYKLSK